MDQEKLAEMIKSLIEKDKENFIKKEGIVETKNYKTGKEVSVKKKLNINFDNNYLQEIPFENVEVETYRKASESYSKEEVDAKITAASTGMESMTPREFKDYFDNLVVTASSIQTP